MITMSPSAQFGDENLGHIGLEGLAVDRTVQDEGGDEAHAT